MHRFVEITTTSTGTTATIVDLRQALDNVHDWHRDGIEAYGFDSIETLADYYTVASYDTVAFDIIHLEDGYWWEEFSSDVEVIEDYLKTKRHENVQRALRDLAGKIRTRLGEYIDEDEE